MWDYDAIFGDDLIGETRIDLEDRYFSSEWRSVTNKPIEHRELTLSNSSTSQGTVKLWTEIIPQENKSNQKDNLAKDISFRPVERYEVRLCVFDTKDLKLESGDPIDGFVKAWFKGC